ncbi:MAG TPA: hypothetical protein VLA19_09190 [Herpetosiphonaceae bacterium]|nr:hypothetical protein [Herpetosiphonaceae bacterium]
MDKERLFALLATQDAPTLLALLSRAYDQMQYDQREAVFGEFDRSLPPAPVEAEALLEEVEAFQRVSLAGMYYAPFAINSKNFMHIPDETKEWFDKLGDLLTASFQLSARGDHMHAAACFSILYELIDAMEDGEEIVFAHEYGSWMIPGNEQEFIAAYMTSLATLATPEEYAAVALPLIQRDSLQSFTTQAYAAAISAANDAQRAHLESEVRQRNIKTGRTP